MSEMRKVAFVTLALALSLGLGASGASAQTGDHDDLNQTAAQAK